MLVLPDLSATAAQAAFVLHRLKPLKTNEFQLTFVQNVSTMKKPIFLSALTVTSLLALNASAADILARVITSTPVVQQFAVPRQVCTTQQQVITETQKSGGGALLGAVAGGAVGNAIGNGSGRALATVIGLIGGAMVGDRIEGPNSQINRVQNMQQCSTQTFYENRASYYNVVYDYQGTQYTAQMAQDPGPYVRLQVTPVGAVNPGLSPASQPGFSGQQIQPAQPQTYYQQMPMQPGFVVQQPVFLAPVVIESYSTYYGRPYYVQPHYVQQHNPHPFNQPFYGNGGSTIHFGITQRFGHWR